MIKCTSCGFKNPGGKFCIQCGSPLESGLNICPKCKTENPPNSKFCNECGTSLISSSKVSRSKKAKNKVAKPRRRSVAPQRSSGITLKQASVFFVIGIAVTAMIVSVLVGGSRTTPTTSTRGGRSTTYNLVWAAEVDEIAEDFNCACPGMGCDLILSECHCEESRGAIEKRNYIQTLLNEKISRDEVIKRFLQKYPESKRI